MAQTQSIDLAGFRYSGRTGRSPANSEQLCTTPEPKVVFLRTPLVRSALVLLAISWLMQGNSSAVVTTLSYIGIASICQLLVLKRSQMRLSLAMPTGSILRQLRLARWLALIVVVGFQVLVL